MRTTSESPRSFVFRRTLSILAVIIVSFSAMLVAQKNSIQPQPQADKLAPVSVPSRGNAGQATKPDGVVPTVPPGFTVSVYAEMRAPRMMVYAPNGDLFVSSPAANNITVLRDTNNDGVFEERSVYAQGGAPAGRGGAGAAGGGGGRGAGAPGGPGGAPGGAPGGQGGGPGRGAGFGGGAPAAAPGGVNPAINGPILGAAAPACTPPS